MKTSVFTEALPMFSFRTLYEQKLKTHCCSTVSNFLLLNPAVSADRLGRSSGPFSYSSPVVPSWPFSPVQ